MPAPTPPSDTPPPRATAVAIVGTDLVLAAFPATPVQIAHALQRLGFDVVVPASWGDELLAAAALARLDERGGVPAVFCACPRVAERLLATGQELAPMLLPLVAPPVAAARYVRAAYEGSDVTVTYLGGCSAAADASIDARMTPREFLGALHDHDIVLGEMPRVFEGIIPPDRRRHLSLPGGLPEATHLAGLATPRRLACLTSAEYAAELAQLVIAREPVLIDVAARLGCACAGATASTPFERAHETVAHLEPPRATHPVVDVSLAGRLDMPLPPPRAPEPPRPPGDDLGASGNTRASPRSSPRTSTPPRPMPAFGTAVPPRSVQHTPPSHTQRYANGEPTSGPLRRRGGVSGFFRAVGSAEQPLARTGEGLALPRAYVAKRKPPVDGTRSSGEQRRAAEEREQPVSRHVEPVRTPTPPPMPALPVVPAIVGAGVPAAGDASPGALLEASADAPRRTTVPVSRVTAMPLEDVAPLPVATSIAPRPTPTPVPTPHGSNGGNGSHGASSGQAARDASPVATADASPAAPPVVTAASPAAGDAARTEEGAAPDALPDDAPALADAETVPMLPAWSSRTSHVAPRVVPPPREPSAGGSSGRELAFFVVGAVLAGLAFALFR